MNGDRPGDDRLGDDRLALHTRGRGPNLVMLHGWGVHSGIWDHVAPRLAGHRRVTLMDLPGHGDSPVLPGEVDRWAEAVLEAAPPRSAWLGWSLGSLVTLRAAMLEPARITRMVLVNTTPRFVQGTDWEDGQEAATMAAFADELIRDPQATVNRFLSLQVQGDRSAREALRELRAVLARAPEPRPDGLEAGLEILRETDLRDGVQGLRQPTLVIAGERDRLTPPAAGRWVADTLAAGRFLEIAGAAHAPFISHAETWFKAVMAFLGGRRG